MALMCWPCFPDVSPDKQKHLWTRRLPLCCAVASLPLPMLAAADLEPLAPCHGHPLFGHTNATIQS
jgi:hypothetical protein